MGKKQHSEFASTGIAKLAYEKYRFRLRKLLAMADDVELLHACWVLDWGRTEDFALPDGYDFPREYLSAKVHDEGRVQSWEIETILTEAWGSSKRRGRRMANTKSWSYVAELVTVLRCAENAESGLNPSGMIFREINRILCRQLPWQARQQNIPDLVRWSSIFSNAKLLDLFHAERGTTPHKFMLLALAFSQLFQRSAYISDPPPLPQLQVSADDIRAFLTAVSDGLPAFRQRSTSIMRTSGLAFREGPLRQKPLVRLAEGNEGIYTCPLRQPLFWRVTDGLYYDVIQHPAARSLIGSEFEKYQRRLFAAAYPDVEVGGDEDYGPPKRIRKAPDIILARNGLLKIVIECKAKRLPLADKVSLSDQVRQSLAVSELAKGVFQLARFRSDIRSGTYSGLQEDRESQFVVLTLDDWIFTGPATKGDVFSKAEEMIRRHALKIEFDLRDIVFCTAADMDIFVTRLTFDKLIAVFAKNRQAEFREYSPHSLAQEFYQRQAKGSDYPLAAEFNQIFPTKSAAK